MASHGLDGDGDDDTSATRSFERGVRSARCASRTCDCTAEEDEHADTRRTSARDRISSRDAALHSCTARDTSTGGHLT